MKGRLRAYQNLYSVNSKKIIFVKNKIEFLHEIDRFSSPFFYKSGQGGLSIADSNSLNSIINSPLRSEY